MSPLSSEHETRQKRPPAPLANPGNQSTYSPTSPGFDSPGKASNKKREVPRLLKVRESFQTVISKNLRALTGGGPHTPAQNSLENQNRSHFVKNHAGLPDVYRWIFTVIRLRVWIISEKRKNPDNLPKTATCQGLPELPLSEYGYPAFGP